MQIQHYISATRRVRQQPLASERYNKIYGILTAGWESISLPQLVVTHSSCRQCESVSLNGVSYLIYDEAIGFHFDVMNRMLDSDNFRGIAVHLSGVLAAFAQTKGNLELSMAIAMPYRLMWDAMPDDSSSDSAQLGHALLYQESFVLMHELIHHLNGPSLTDVPLERMRGMVREITERRRATAKRRQMPEEMDEMFDMTIGAYRDSDELAEESICDMLSIGFLLWRYVGYDDFNVVTMSTSLMRGFYFVVITKLVEFVYINSQRLESGDVSIESFSSFFAARYSVFRGTLNKAMRRACTEDQLAEIDSFGDKLSAQMNRANDVVLFKLTECMHAAREFDPYLGVSNEMIDKLLDPKKQKVSEEVVQAVRRVGEIVGEARVASDPFIRGGYEVSEEIGEQCLDVRRLQDEGSIVAAWEALERLVEKVDCLWPDNAAVVRFRETLIRQLDQLAGKLLEDGRHEGILAHRASMEVAKRLVMSNPRNNEWQRQLFLSSAILRVFGRRAGLQDLEDEMLSQGYHVLSTLRKRGIELDAVGGETFDDWTREFDRLTARREALREKKRLEDAERRYRQRLQHWKRRPFWSRWLHRKPRRPM